MNEFTPISLDSVWIIGAIAVSFFSGCVYRLCVLLSRDTRTGESNDATVNDPTVEDLNNRFDRELRHVRQLQNELLQVRQAVKQRVPGGAPDAGKSTNSPQPAGSATYAKTAASAKPTELGIDPFKLAVSGASIKVLMNRCRLSRAEAELVFSIHGAGSGRKAGPVRRASHASRQALTA